MTSCSFLSLPFLITPISFRGFRLRFFVRPSKNVIVFSGIRHSLFARACCRRVEGRRQFSATYRRIQVHFRREVARTFPRKFHRAQNLFPSKEEMAARPFSSVLTSK
jgi:hypothetical protein